MRRHQLALSWIAIFSLFATIELAVFSQNLFWMIMGFWALCIALLPAVVARDIHEVLPFGFLFLIAFPFYIFASLLLFAGADQTVLPNLMRAIEVAATFLIALVTIMDLHAYTEFRTNGAFAIILTVLMTMALSSVFAIADFLSDQVFGTQLLRSNNELMINLVFSFLGGVVMGIFIYIYMRKTSSSRSGRHVMSGPGGGL